MRRLAILMILASACGDDAPTKKTRGGEAAPGSKPAGAAPAGAKPAGRPGAKDGPQPLVVKAKVPDEYRREFTESDFSSDPTGEVNRDPFFSYLVAPAGAGTATNPGAPVQPIKDECENRTVAAKAAFRDMKLVGIILRGTRNFAMFTDSSKVGWTVFLGDCVSKDKARVVEITQGCVKLEVRGEALPGAAAPPPREELACLHPDDIAVQ